ncbi:hypothetical protein OH492_29260 [Vibrio chagasii]|nr:hypothetical protein [Vibrio chagasii]
MKKGKSNGAIYTSHDPDLIKLADKVVVLDEGAVVLCRVLSSSHQSLKSSSYLTHKSYQLKVESKQGVANVLKIYRDWQALRRAC